VAREGLTRFHRFDHHQNKIDWCRARLARASLLGPQRTSFLDCDYHPGRENEVCEPVSDASPDDLRIWIPYDWKEGFSTRKRGGTEK